MKLNVTNGNLIFIGFMGSGKSQVGRAISKKLDLLFLDSDTILESLENQRVLSIFKEKGEKYFRDLERTFAKQVKSSIQNSVISVGGGFPTAVEKLNELGLVIYLDIDFDEMIAELSKFPEEMEKRPLLENLDNARRIYQNRTDLYENQADIIIPISPKSVDEVVEQVLVELEQFTI
jgi:shikimate kinase